MDCGGAETVMLVLGSGCKHRLTVGKRFDCTETIRNQMLADSDQNPISEWQVTNKLQLVSGFKSELNTDFHLHADLLLFIRNSYLHFFPTLHIDLSHILVSPHANPSLNE